MARAARTRRAARAPRAPSQQRPEDAEVAAILGQVLSLRRLDAHRKAAKAPLAEDAPERRDAEAAAPDVLVAIEPAAERTLRVVQVKRDDAIQTDGGVEGGERRGESCRRAKIVAGGERVLGVETDAQALAAARLRAKAAELLE